MSNRYINRLSLGTTQFGLDYGIANRRGRPSKEEVFAILREAHHRGIDTLDTACSYGGSEELIGEFTACHKRAFNIISKTPHFQKTNISRMADYFDRTLERLKLSKVYGYLVHRFGDITAHRGLWRKLESLKERGLADNIGLSVYRCEDVEYILENGLAADIILIPYNILDQRFKAYLPVLKKKGMKVYTRSVFLQGLFFIDMDTIERVFLPVKGRIEAIRDISSQCKIPIHLLCLSFTMLNPLIDKVVMGVDSQVQLKENISCLDRIEKMQDIYTLLEGLKFDDEEVLMPSRWRI